MPSYNFGPKIRVIEQLEKHMTKSRFALPRGFKYYPSESSVQWTDEHGIKRTEGACLRACWYRIVGCAKPDSTSFYQQWIFALGNAVEDILTEQFKQMGIWVNNSVRFQDIELNISGELDLVLRETDNQGNLLDSVYCAECKSIYGYNARKEVCGNKSVEGKPKTSQLLQAAIYAYIGKKLKQFDYTKMLYFARDDDKRNEFDITLDDFDGIFHIDPDKTTIKNPVSIYVNNKKQPFTFNDVIERYQNLNGYVRRCELPPKDYEAEWSKDKVEIHNSLGEVAKTTYANWKRSPKRYPIGDWKCRYCSFKESCDIDQGINLSSTESDQLVLV